MILRLLLAVLIWMNEFERGYLGTLGYSLHSGRVSLDVEIPGVQHQVGVLMGENCFAL